MSIKLADRMKELRASEIRELLKVTEKPEVISFAGGLPAPELFPVEQMKEVAVKVLEENGMQALQYATTEGYLPLREKIAQRMNMKFQTSVTYENILITSGSQQGLDMSGKILINKGDRVLCERPTYLGALNAFRAYEPEFIEMETDDEGVVPENLEKILESTDNIKLIYVIPDFQNPTGRTWTAERRKKFMEIVDKHEIPVLEDNPYGELRFDGDMLPSIKSFDKKGLVIYLGTFSKTFCPGLRIGWLAADTEILAKYELVKQGVDLHTSTISQREISKFMEMFDFDSHVEGLKRVYRKRRDVIVSVMREKFPKGISFTCPEGGLFAWVELPPHVNAREVLVKCLENNVAFVPGGAFYAKSVRENTFRLNYSNMPEERIAEGISRLSEVLKGYV